MSTSDRQGVVPPWVTLRQMTDAYYVSRALYAVAKLGIADLLYDGPKSCNTLAHETNLHERSLYRLLRALASLGVFAESDDGLFELTPVATYLCSDVPNSIRAGTIMRGESWYWRPWEHILHCVQTGESAYHYLYGMEIFQYLETDPDAASMFNSAMTEGSEAVGDPICLSYDFSRFQMIVDVGGGQGSFMASMLRTTPNTHGILFDTSNGVKNAVQVLEQASVADRCKVVTGDFFVAVPSGGDCYVLKQVLHDWDDDKAAAILRSCRSAMDEQAKLLVVDYVVPNGNAPHWSKLGDLHLLIAGGQERTAAEFRALFASAGFEMTAVHSTQSARCIVEGKPV